MKAKNINIILSLSFVILAIALYQSVGKLSSSSIVTTGIYIKFLAISLGIAGILDIVRCFFVVENKKIVFTENPKRFIALVALLTMYVGLMGYFGFVISTLIFLPLTMFAMGYRKIGYSLIYSVMIVAFVYVLFVQVFDIPLPELTLFQ
ncbi:MAG: tripartite tricarboxylate transporter TctB family protein [Gammaproteobacteria bacterium]|nr:tripartite tricarboxylate transporter TctB family protein [Gammaproteobacteria bacterium]